MKLSREMFSVYGVTNNTPNIENIEKAVKGGIKIIQLRIKNIADEELLQIAIKVKKICKDKALFIINDNVDIALKVDADGVHLGQEDMKIAKAREILKEKIVGVSAHNTQEALRAEKEGADYLGCGAMFETHTKSHATPLAFTELKNICSTVNIPVVAIGGITLENMKYLKDCGIDGVAVSTGLFRGDAEKNAKEFAEGWKRLLKRC